MLENSLLSRRRLLAALGILLASPLAGCDGQDPGTLAAKLISPEQMREIGEQTWRQILAQFPLSPNPVLQRRLQEIGRRVVAASNPGDRAWQFVVFRDEQINAFAVPGGKVGFFEGMFVAASNDAQIAAVLGHEVGHINAQHAAQRLVVAYAKQMGMAAILAALEAGDVAFSRQIAAVLGAGVEYGLVMPFSRQQEMEADRLGVAYMAKTGFPPREAVAFWKTMIRLSGGRARPLEFLSTHPASEKRMAALEVLVKKDPLAIGG